MERRTLFLIDGYNIIFRSYFAFMRNPLRNKAGENTSAIFGFVRTLIAILRAYNPQYVVVLFDSLVDTFRTALYPSYKATRERTPDDLRSQIPQVEEVLQALDVPVVRADGYEADDLIATYAAECHRLRWKCAIVSTDKDIMQLVDDDTYMLKPSGAGFEAVDAAGVMSAKGVAPGQIVDYLALLGDTSDNVPGVPGIGEKTGRALLEKYRDIDNIYEHIDELKPAHKKALLENRAGVDLSKKLIILHDNAPLPQPLEKLPPIRLRIADAQPLLLKHDMHGLLEDLTLFLADGSDGGAASAQGGGGSTAKTRTSDYQLVATPDQLEECLHHIRQHKICAIDVQTDSVDPMRANVVGVSCAIAGGRGWYIPYRGPHGPVFDEDALRQKIGALLEDSAISLVGHDIKYALKVLRRWGIHANAVVCDTMVAAWLLDTTLNAFRLDSLAKRYLNYLTMPLPAAAKKDGFASIPLDEARQYAAESADITYALYEKLVAQLKRDEVLWKLFQEVEMELIPILTDMEYTGILVRTAHLEEYGQHLRGELETIKTAIYDISGYEFNINSTKQLQKVLFEEMHLTPIKKTKTGYSTDTSVLHLLASDHPLPEKILHYRQLTKLLTTYVEVLPKLVNPTSQRIHTTFNLTGTATGRISSNDPNLQNIPIRDEEGREIRRAFIPPEGHRLISADYSQIELVIFAHLSGDATLRETLNAQIDIHRRTGSLIFGIPLDKIDSHQRRVAKTINFGVMYGMSAFRLSRELRITQQEALEFIDRYFQTYVGVREYMDDMVATATREGGIRTILGRWRDVPGINDGNKIVREGAKRIAINSPIQGSAADIIKLSMLNIDRRIDREQLTSKMLLQVHDELLVEAPVHEVEHVSALLREEMCGCYPLAVPLRVDISVGDSWGMLK